MIDIEVDDAIVEPGELVVRGAREGDAFLLSLYGELDTAGARVLARKVRMARSIRADQVVLDLSGLQFVDSAGLHALVEVRDELSAAGQRLALLRGPRAVQRVFELTDAEALFDFES